ncbi:MAG: hypothetical protein ACYDH6_01305 [Acidimicrobiales bacterium]
MTMLGADDRVRCPIDDVDFRPYYTDGECPICRWRPEQPVATPWWRSTDPVVVAFVAMIAVSVIMAIVVIAAYTTA